MAACLALLPCAVAAFAVMALRLSVLLAALLAFTTACVLWATGVFSPAELKHLQSAAADAVILEMLVGFVIFPGILFVEATNRSGGLKALIGAIESLSLPPPRAVILIALGIGVLMESLTGYGVSMFVTIPLLLQAVNRTSAIFLALLGMSLMPWGALSISALLGAQLAGLPPQTLADALLWTSGPIAAALPVFCLPFVKGVSWKDAVYAVAAGAVLFVGIASASRWIGVEVAGVGGGLALILLSFAFATGKRALIKSLSTIAILPYGLLIAAVIVQKLIVPHWNATGISLVIETTRVSFNVLASPGIALSLATLITLVMQPAEARSKEGPSLLRHVMARSWPPLASIFMFLMAARLLVEIGSIAALASLLSELGRYPAVAVVTALGGVGSYVTGSGVASNALFMPSAAATGESLGALGLFAALQHSGAAHIGVASLPIIAILLAALPNRQMSDERTAMRMALGLAAIWFLFVVTSGTIQVAVMDGG